LRHVLLQLISLNKAIKAMSYQVIARKFRPGTFEEVVGQSAIVKTLKNALKSQRLAHAYLFCGLRGTGKTTLARLLAKAMNCLNPSESMDPCGTCSSCKDFQSSQALDFIEIDGASHRGIDDIKSIIDTLTYSSIHKYKIILIDEVHMLTKEAFNALLKTLEEPPSHVKFIFATTEPHKLPSTILSRCQRFDLARIPYSLLAGKLKKIAQTLNLTIDDAALELIAERSEGSLRDAESLFERVIAGSSGVIHLEHIFDLLGYFGFEMLEELDEVISKKSLAQGFTLSEKLFSSGKDIKIFFDQYRQHLRHIVCSKLGLQAFTKNYPLKPSSVEAYQIHQANYLIEVLTDQLKTTQFDKKIETEALILLLIQSKNRISLEDIVDRLESLISTSDTPLQEIQEPETQTTIHTPVVETAPVTEELPSVPEATAEETLPLKPPQFYDTIMQFASVELEGSLKK
jgi:DNA polymerase-3 subunit gamma/tau